MNRDAFGEVLHSFLPQICVTLEDVLLKLHVKLTPGGRSFE